MAPNMGRFLLALFLFAVVYFFLPDGVRPWFALVIVLGAVLYQRNAGAVEALTEHLK